MNNVRKMVETDTGAVWGEYSLEKDEPVGEVDIQRTDDERRHVRYTKADKVIVDGTVPAGDERTDEQLAKDVVFTGKLNPPSFRPT